MWHKIISEFQKENKITFDLKIELHLAYYVMNLLKEHYKFFIHDENLIIKDSKSDKEISKNTFFYWYSFTRFQELIKEEENIFREFNELKDKVLPVIEKIKLPELKDSDDESTKKKKIDKIKSNNQKITKLQDHIKSEADNSNHKINNLRNFRSMYPNIDSLERFLKNIQIIVENA
jgi:seryl-tRNA synthetase